MAAAKVAEVVNVGALITAEASTAGVDRSRVANRVPIPAASVAVTAAAVRGPPVTSTATNLAAVRTVKAPAMAIRNARSTVAGRRVIGAKATVNQDRVIESSSGTVRSPATAVTGMATAVASGDRDRDGDNRKWNGDDRDRNWSGFNRSDFDRYNNDRYSRDNWRGDDVRRNWWRGYDRNNIPFRSSWWNGYYGDNWPVYSPYRYSRWSNRPNYWWGYTTAPLLTDWLVFGFDRPRYWGYGPSANIYYQDDYVYYDNRRTIPVNDYYQQIYDLAHSVPNISQSEAESMDWRPLGVFAVGRDANAGSQRALQLAVNKDGVLTGTYFNRESGEVHPLSGMVDERTQRAAWAFADGTEKNLVFETALYNLTRDQSTMMVHYGPSASDTEVWHLVRLEQPDETGNTQPLQQQSTTRTLP